MGHELITSVHNSLVKRLQRLLERKGREEQGSFLVEGVHLIEEALLSQVDVLTVMYDVERGIDPVIERALERKGELVKVIAASAAVLTKLSETTSPQGIVAVVKKQRNDWERWLETVSARDFLVLLLDEIQDPGNLGTILRTADAAGIDAVFMGNGSVDLYNSKVIRATMGAFFRLPIFTEPLAGVADRVKRLGGELIATSLHTESRPYDEVTYAGKVAIVIGNEGRGVSTDMLTKADMHVHIPLYGSAESLNAAVAAGIMVYEARRQRKTALI